MSMHWMGFDVHAMVKPKTRQDVERLLEELRMELKNLNSHLSLVYARLEADAKNRPPDTPGPKAGPPIAP